MSLGLRGLRGYQHVLSARTLRDGELIFAVGVEYSTTESLLAAGDRNTSQAQRIMATWAPTDQLEISFRHSSTTNRNRAFATEIVQALGNPALSFKYGVPLSSELSVGGAMLVEVPTSPNGSGLEVGAFVAEGLAVASYRPISTLELAANLGYRFDRSRELFDSVGNQALRFTARVNKVNAILARLGASATALRNDWIALESFLEMSAELAPGVSMSEGPTLLTGALRLSTTGFRRVELTAGADYRLGGAPTLSDTSYADAFAGVVPWQVFARVALSLGGSYVEVREVPEADGVADVAATCTSAEDCAADQRCVQGTCAVVLEVVKEVPKVPPMFVIAGTVVDESGEPVRDALIAISGYQDSHLAVDPETGAFRSWPLSAGEGLVQIKVAARGYHSTEETLPKGADGEVKELTVALKSNLAARKGVLKGSIKNARTGEAIKNVKVFLPGLGKTVKSDGNGAFVAADLKLGRHAVLISARGYITQKKKIEIRAGDVVILNVDLRPRRRRR